MMRAPVLNTERLRLRPMEGDDWWTYLTLMQSQRAQYMGGPFSETVAWGMFCADHAQWDLLGAGALMIEATPDGSDPHTVGQVAVNLGPLFPEPELGWMLFDGYQGQGYAVEAAQRMLSWARKQPELRSLVSYIDPDNIASRRLALRLGAIEDADAARPDPSDVVYRHF